MAIIKLREPRPRVKPAKHAFHSFSFVSVITLPSVKVSRLPRLDVVANDRQSRRAFATPLKSQQLADLLWHSARTRARGTSQTEGWESRIAPSAGGCHPIHIGVLRAPSARELALIYDATHHALGVMRTRTAVLRRCLYEVGACLPIGRGTLLWFLADTERTARKYKNPESLIWRDSGALLATIAFAAEGLGLQACGLGLHETPSLRRVFALPDHVVGVGGCLVSGGT